MTPDPRSVPDEELAALVGAGAGDEACAELFRRYRQRVYLWCYRYTHDRDEAVELAQEVFVRVFRGLDSFAGRSRFSTWVYSIARNHCLNALARDGGRWRKRLVPIDGLEIEDRRWQESLGEAERAEQLERLLARAGERMPADELAAFVLHYRDGLTVKEITRTLGCENQTGARTLIQNARRKFQRLVRGREERRG